MEPLYAASLGKFRQAIQHAICGSVLSLRRPCFFDFLLRRGRFCSELSKHFLKVLQIGA
jgi:hypothetical protein